MTFEQQMAAWARKTNLKAEKVVFLACSKLSREIQKETPVDTGRLVGNWIPSLDAPILQTVERFSADTEGVDRLARQATGRVYYLVNNLPYARDIEYKGRSPIKAPAGMVRVSISSFRAALEEATR